jgi:ankyrin repeat protein
MYSIRGSPSGRPPKKTGTEKFQLNIDDPDDFNRLLRACAQKKALTSPGKKPQRYQPLFKHPLPVSDHSAYHDTNLRRATCCALENQVAAAVTFGDAWVLEELYMQGAPVNIADKSGFTPLHLAVQMNSFECVMVLINAGADVNATTLSGVTPLYLAVAAGGNEAAAVLRENGGLMEIDLSGQGAPIKALDVDLPTKKCMLEDLDRRLCLPPRHTLY